MTEENKLKLDIAISKKGYTLHDFATKIFTGLKRRSAYMNLFRLKNGAYRNAAFIIKKIAKELDLSEKEIIEMLTEK